MNFWHKISQECHTEKLFFTSCGKISCSIVLSCVRRSLFPHNGGKISKGLNKYPKCHMLFWNLPKLLHILLRGPQMVQLSPSSPHTNKFWQQATLLRGRLLVVWFSKSLLNSHWLLLPPLTSGGQLRAHLCLFLGKGSPSWTSRLTPLINPCLLSWPGVLQEELFLLNFSTLISSPSQKLEMWGEKC